MNTNKATYKMHYRLMRLSFGRGKSAEFHAIAPSIVDHSLIDALAKLKYNA